MLKCSIYNNVFPRKEKCFEIYNSMTKARISVQDRDYLDNIIINGADDSTMSVLVENGFLVDENLDEVSALEYAYNKRYFNATALGVIMLPTMSCNFDCPYCFEKPSAHVIGPEMPNYFCSVEKYITKQASNFRHINLNFFGGEPLIKKDKWNHLQGMCRDCPRSWASQFNQLLLRMVLLLTKQQWSLYFALIVI